jgi:hypothetical protein
VNKQVKQATTIIRLLSQPKQAYINMLDIISTRAVIV